MTTINYYGTSFTNNTIESTWIYAHKVQSKRKIIYNHSIVNQQIEQIEMNRKIIMTLDHSFSKSMIEKLAHKLIKAFKVDLKNVKDKVVLEILQETQKAFEEIGMLIRG